MKRTRHSAEQIIEKVRESDAMLASGKTLAQVVLHLGVSEQSYYRSRNQCGGMRSEEVQRLNELKIEIARMNRLIANQAIDIARRRARRVLGQSRLTQRYAPRLADDESRLVGRMHELVRQSTRGINDVW